jgi:phosphatidate cytidylyltransferase
METKSDDNSKNRIYVGLTLATVVLLCLFYDLIGILFIGIFMAVIYDACYMHIISLVRKEIVIAFAIVMEIFNILLVQLYIKDYVNVIMIITIVQISDVYQYIAGKFFGKNKIGWLSKNKTYEGYVYGLLLTIITFVLFCRIQYIFEIYVLGITSGLTSSLLKRTLQIKDYSDLLGPHGGWCDRIDSIIMPIFFYYFFY